MQGNSGYWLQPPPNLPRRGGTDTLGCLILNGLPTNKSNLHLPYGGEREGADVCGWVITPTIDFSPHLASPVGEGQILSVVWY